MEIYKKKSLFKCHYYHIISKITLCSLIFIFFLLIIEKIMIATTLDYKQTTEMRSITYLFSVFETEKIFLLLLFVFIFGVSFNSSQDNYRVFLITNNVSRSEYFITKFIIIIKIAFIYVFFQLLITFIICLSFKIIITYQYLYSYLSLIYIIIYYGLLSTLLTQIFNNYYIVILPFILYVLISSLEINKFISFITIIIKNGVICNGYLFGSLLILIIFIFNLVIFNIKDLNSI